VVRTIPAIDAKPKIVGSPA